MITVGEKLSNTDLIIEDVKIAPQTYGTILKNEVYNLTYQFQLRKKINKILKDNRLMKATIPGTRGQAILYIEPRKYKIIVEASRVGVNVYYFFESEKFGKFYIKLHRYWILHNTDWIEHNEELTLFEGHILKFI